MTAPDSPGKIAIVEEDTKPERRLSARQRRERQRLRKWLTLLAVAAATGVALWSGLWDTLENWSQREVKQDALWGVPILWWGRIGKGIQFFAGFVALIDIYGPARLEALKERYADRAGRSTRMIELARIGPRVYRFEERLRKSLDHDLRGGGTSLEENPASKRDPEYEDLLRSLRAEFRDKPFLCAECRFLPLDAETPPAPMLFWECKHGAPAFDRHVDAFMRQRADVKERLARRIFADHYNFLSVSSFISSLLAVAAPLGLGALLGVPDPIIAICALAIVFTLHASHARYSLPLWLTAKCWRTAAAILGHLSKAANERTLRKWALRVFIIGFFFDALAS